MSVRNDDDDDGDADQRCCCCCCIMLLPPPPAPRRKMMAASASNVPAPNTIAYETRRSRSGTRDLGGLCGVCPAQPASHKCLILQPGDPVSPSCIPKKPVFRIPKFRLTSSSNRRVLPRHRRRPVSPSICISSPAVLLHNSQNISTTSSPSYGRDLSSHASSGLYTYTCRSTLFPSTVSSTASLRR